MTLLQTLGYVLVFLGLVGLAAVGLLWCAINIDARRLWRRK